jgi:peptide/nickel transport system substrate-binding protein
MDYLILGSLEVSDGDRSVRLGGDKQRALLAVLLLHNPAPSEFLGQQFWSCKSFVPRSTANNNLSEFCDPRFDAIVRSALAAEDAKSPTAAQLWSKADRQFTDQAPTVNLANPSQIDLVSHRVGDYQYNPQLGVLLDELWVH